MGLIWRVCSARMQSRLHDHWHLLRFVKAALCHKGYSTQQNQLLSSIA